MSADDKRRRATARFFTIYALIEGTALILAVLAWVFVHNNMVYLIGSIVMIALVGSTFVMGRVLSNATKRDENE